MTKEKYLAVQGFFKSHNALFKAAVVIQKGFELIIYILYPCFLLALMLGGNDFWQESLWICGLSFIAVSVFRRRFNAKRPYEELEFTPLINKKSGGQSFPSRHCFSAAIIAVNIAAVFLPLGIAVGLMAVVIAALRVAFGVHYIKDVAAGLIIGILLGSIVFII